MNMTNSDCQTARRRLGSESNSDRGQKAHGRNPSAEENPVSRTICDQEGRDRRTAPSRARARKAAKKVQDLDETAKQFGLGAVDSDRIAAMSTEELLATLKEFVAAEAFYLSRSKDSESVREDQPTERGFKLVFRRWPPGTDIDTIVRDLVAEGRNVIQRGQLTIINAPSASGALQ